MMSFSSSQSTQAFSDVSQPGRDLEELVNGLASSKADEALRVFARSHLENISYIDVCTYPDMTPAKTLDHGILAVAQSAQTTACDIVIPILRPGTTATHLRLWFDPITDDFVTVNLSGQAPLTLWHPKSLAAVTILPEHQHRLEPSTWTVLTTAAPNENIECTALLDILLRPRNFCTSSLRLPEAPSGSKRRASTEASSSKKQKADTGALRKEAWAAAHPLFEVQDGQAVQMAGPSRDDNYNITREQHLATTPSASLYTSRLSLRPGQLIVTKALTIRPNTLIQTAENWLKEISTHRELGPHPRIIPYLGSDARVFTLYTEYVNTPPLSGHIDTTHRCNCSQDAFTILSDIADALQFIHASGFVHNDIKPSNILYHPTRGAIVIDFGLGTKTTEPASSGGTPWYVPPEYIRRRKRGPPSDIFALGVTMLWVLGKCALPDYQQSWMIRDLHGQRQRLEVRAQAQRAQVHWLTQVKTMWENLSTSEQDIECVVGKMVCKEGRITAKDVVTCLKLVSL